MDENGVTYGDKTTIGNLYYNHDPLRVTGGTFYNVGTKLDQKLAEGYTMIKGEICEMTSYKTYIPYNSETQTSAHWEDDPEGKVYYYYTVVAVQSVSTAEELVSAVKQKGVLKAIQLNNDINMGNTLVEVRNGKGTYLDLNGFTLTGTGANNWEAIIKTNESVLNISNGTVKGGTSSDVTCVYAYNNITNMYDVNVTAENGSLAVWAETGADEIVVAEGYVSVSSGDYYTVSVQSN